jgi:hypothetical protein
MRLTPAEAGSSQHGKRRYSRIVFLEPSASSGVIHVRIVKDALIVDLPRFCREVITGTRRWLD